MSGTDPRTQAKGRCCPPGSCHGNSSRQSAGVDIAAAAVPARPRAGGRASYRVICKKTTVLGLWPGAEAPPEDLVERVVADRPVALQESAMWTYVAVRRLAPAASHVVNCNSPVAAEGRAVSAPDSSMSAAPGSLPATQLPLLAYYGDFGSSGSFRACYNVFTTVVGVGMLSLPQVRLILPNCHNCR
eukprot:scaffold2254_cov393-Prasinococcus_capsulatus_cf.AAC.7